MFTQTFELDASIREELGDDDKCCVCFASYEEDDVLR